MNRIIVVIIILLSLEANAQFSLDHYHPIDLIVQKKIESCSIYTLNLDSSLTIEQTYFYDSSGLEIKNKRNFQDYSFIWKYDENNNMVAEYSIPFNEEYSERDTFIYNRKNKLLARISYRTTEKEIRRSEYVYNDSLITEEKYYWDGSLRILKKYNYNELNKLVRIEKNSKTGNIENWIYVYNNDGNIISFTTINSDGEEKLKHIFEYDERGLRIRHSIYSLGEILFTVFETKYDSIGLITEELSITHIQNNDVKTGEQEKTIYQYEYR